MKPCTRIEIVVEEPLARRFARKLQELGATGYTLIPRASGSGDRGLRRGDDPTGTASNCVFVVAVEDEETAQRIVDGVRPILSQSGGICLVSPAQMVKH